MRGAGLGVWLLFLSTASAAADSEWSLPTNPDTLVLELRITETGPNSGERVPPATLLQIARNGRFVGVDSVTQAEVAGRLGESELRNLVSQIVDQQRIRELRTDDLVKRLSAESARLGKEWRVRNASVVRVRVWLAAGVHTFECPCPELLRTRFPEMKELVRVCSILHRLQNIAAVAQAGGPEEAKRLAALANAELKRQNGSPVQVTSGDLTCVRGKAGDLRQMQFVIDPELNGEQGRAVHISLMESPSAAPRVSLTTVASPL